jgi:hypothetical protein
MAKKNPDRDCMLVETNAHTSYPTPYGVEQWEDLSVSTNI